MSKTLLKNLCLLASLVLFAGAAAAETVRDIGFEGNQRVEDSTIRLQVSSKVGSELDRDAVEKDTKEIYRSGFFKKVTAKFDKGKLIFVVVEKPSIRTVFIKGNEELTKETLLEKLNLGGRRFLDRGKVKAGIEAAKKYYTEQGLFGTEIEYEVADAGENQVDLTFDVKEGDKKYVKDIVFEGNKAIDSSDLMGAIDSRTYSWWRTWITGRGVLKDEVLDNDVRQITRYYLARGYVDVRVTKPSVEEIDKGLKVVFQIEEGPVYQFRKITATGTLVDNSEAKTLEGIKSKSGEIFNVDNLREDTFAITDKYTDTGYAFANVTPDTNIDRQARQVDINFQIDKGKLVHVNRVNISGNDKTGDNVVRRSLKVNEAEQYSSSKVRKSQELLQRLGYFDEVTITPDPSEYEDQVDLNVAVREGTTGTFSIGAGVSSGDGFILSSRISENNIFGTGNALTLDLNNGTRRENYILSFDDPRVNDSYLSLGADALRVRREFDKFDRLQTGGAVTAGYPLWFLGPEARDDVRASLRYELTKVEIDHVDLDAPTLIQNEKGTSTSSSITPKIVRNTIDNPIDPSTGSRQSASVEVAGLGGDQEFWLTEVSNTIYYPIAKTSYGNFVISQRINLGYGDTMNNDTFPLFKRFFPGGINSVRGYDSRKMGPKDAQGNEFGGSKQLVANFDLIFPLVNSMGLSGVTFFDIGDAFDDNESIDIGSLRKAVGWGIRWRSPIAPIRIEVGYPLDKEDGDKSMVFNFSFGSPM